MADPAPQAELTQADEYLNAFDEHVASINADSKNIDDDSGDLESEVAQDEGQATSKTKTPDESGHSSDKTAPADVNWEKRYSDLRRLHDEERKQLADLKTQMDSLRSNVAPSSPLGTPTTGEDRKDEGQGIGQFKDFIKSLPEDNRALFEDHPEIADALDGYLKVFSNSFKVDNSTISQIVASKLAEEKKSRETADIQYKQQEYEQLVASEIPDFVEKVNNPAFQDWRNQNGIQVETILSKYDKFSTEGIKEVFEIYDEESRFREEFRKNRDRKLSAMSPSPKSKTTRPEAMPNESDYDASFEYFARKSTSNNK